MLFERRFLGSWLAAAVLLSACIPPEPMDPPDLAPPPEQLTEIAVKAMGPGQGIITSAPYGISCGVTCKNMFPLGKPVTIVATPDFRSSFEGFRGSCKGMNCTLTPESTDPLDVYATFKQLACMPLSSMGCAVCNPYGSWVPGYGRAKCSDDGMWGNCVAAGPGSQNVNQSDMIFHCGGVAPSGSWTCEKLTTEARILDLPTKDLVSGLYDISSIYVYTDAASWNTKAGIRLSVFVDGSEVIQRTQNIAYAPNLTYVVSFKDLYVNIPSGCHAFSASLSIIPTVPKDGSVRFLGMSGFSITGK